MERIAVFRALQLGDMLCAVPALSALRAAWPSAHIALIGLPWARAFAERYPMLVDELIVFPGAPGFPEQSEEGHGLPGFFADARRRDFDLAIQLHGSGGVANDIVLGLGARSNAGFVQPGEARRGCFMPWPERGRETERCLALFRFMGLVPETPPMWLPLGRADLEECEAALRRFGAHRAEIAIVHAGAQLASRRWPAERFGAVADALAALGLTVALTGVAAEAPIAAAVRRAMTHPALDLTGALSIGGLAALIERATLTVCNDTGISHIAAALGAPSLVIASGSDTRRWAPADGERHRVLAHYPACRPCMHRVCPYGHECALGVSAGEAIAAARLQLRLHRKELHAA